MKYNRILIGKGREVLRKDVGLIIPDEKKRQIEVFCEPALPGEACRILIYSDVEIAHEDPGIIFLK